MPDKPVDPKTINMTKRERIIYNMLRVKTLAELDEISKEVDEWLKEYPDDEEIIGNCEGLAMLEGCFK